jgi:uncharacterized glyoxalase superfamily protein PhnB/N-acetylglutamate synthase-like GNAT family acetyltransferase
MIFQHAVPILYASDVSKSIQYYTEVFGFTNHWAWDDAPSFGGVSKDGVELFFCKDGQGHPGTWISIMVNDVDELYQRILEKEGKVLSPPKDMEWGMREMLVEDPDGHIIRFGRGRTSDKKSEAMPAGIRIVERLPTTGEYEALIQSVGWRLQPGERTEKILNAPVHALVAEEEGTGKAIGCVLLLGDGASFFYIKDMMIHHDYQRKHIGTALMEKLNEWLELHAPPEALIGLYTGENLASFYRQFGFRPSFGMCRRK